MKDSSGQARWLSPKNQVGYIFIIKGKVGRGRRPPSSKDVARKWGTRGWSYPRSQLSPWDRPPNEGPWLRAGKNSRMSQNKVKAGLLTHSIGRMGSVSESETALGDTHSIDKSVDHPRR